MFFLLPRNTKKKSKNQLESLSTPELRSWFYDHVDVELLRPKIAKGKAYLLGKYY